MIPAVFGAVGVEAEFIEAGIFVFFEIFGIVEPPMNAVEELRDEDGCKAGVIVSEFRFFVSGYGVARFVKPFGGSQVERAGAPNLIGCKTESAVGDLAVGQGERAKGEGTKS
jgi:hypothetical protein